MDKSPDAYRTISEVAEELDLPQHVLRFWETRFTQIKPLKRGGGRRYYRPEDIELLRAIQHLLYSEGYTIKGVQRILKDNGARAVAQMTLELAPRAAAPAVAASRAPSMASSPEPSSKPSSESSFEPVLTPSFAAAREAARAPELEQEPSALADVLRPAPMPDAPPAAASRLVPPSPEEFEPAPSRPTPAIDGVVRAPQIAAFVDFARPFAASANLAVAQTRSSTESLGAPRAATTRVEPPRWRGNEIERLKAALFELMECERTLEAARKR